MPQTNDQDISFDEFDEVRNPPPDVSDFERVVERRVARRAFLRGSAALGAAFIGGGASSLAPRSAEAAARLAFAEVPVNTLDTVTVPAGYRWHVVVQWGDPLWSDAPAFDADTRGTGASQERAFGDNNDGMALFMHGRRHILAVNNEYVNRRIIYGNRASGTPENADDVRKGKAGHGVTVVEVAERDGRWSIVHDSPYNRRITADTPMELTGPARGHALLKTDLDPTGTLSLGTWNNCGNGRTPWDTYLACEENFNGYFSSSDPDYPPNADHRRYGVGPEDWGYAWATTDERFDISRHPNEPNRAGYVVEINPLDPDSTPRKRTALGRFKHENVEVVLAADGRVVAYMGDDERGEFLYRFVSEGAYRAGGDNGDLLERGTLSVAKFADDGRGEWIALTPASTGMSSAAEIAVRTRQAASAVGATTMDRPEWVAANPTRAEAYCCLTNNKNRAKKPNAGGNPTPINGPNPREANKYGQIVRWRPDGGDHGAAEFDWDLFVVAGNPVVHDDARAGSDNVTPDNMFNSPDGLAFDRHGLMWLQTDGNYSNEGDFAGQGNNQMLIADPESGEIRRFLVGPRECEVTGLAFSPDRRSVFVGIQHPGEKGGSHFPGGGDSVPRSAVIAIRREDGGLIG